VIEPTKVDEALADDGWILAMQDELNQFKRNDVWDLEDCKEMNTPMHPTCTLSKEDQGSKVDQKLYRGMIGSLLYLTASRPDILFSVCLCARFQSDPR